MAQNLVRGPALALRGYEAGKALIGSGSPPKLDLLMVVGMGGSAVGGDLLCDLVMDRTPVPIICYRGLGVPAFVTKDSGVATVSYSGETAETLSAFFDARAKGARLWAITSGGTLAGRAQAEGVPLALIPGGLPPRAALGALYFGLVGLAEGLGLIGSQVEAVEEALEVCENLNNRYRPEAEEEENPALTLARKLYQGFPSVFGVHGSTDGVARRWKSQFNENSKMAASFEVLPELAHNEVVSFEVAPGTSGPERTVILLVDEEDRSEVVQQREHLAGWLEEQGITLERVSGEGRSRLTRLTSLVLFGDWVSYYAAVLRGVDPTPIVSIDTIKERGLEEQTGR
jgi:glucose/mannose-6-phosphate isomerase